jgi:hypothetical protein
VEIGDNGLYLGNISEGVGVGLGVAAGNYEVGMGGDAGGPAQEFVRFTVGLMGNGAGIENIDVGGRIPIGNSVALSNEGSGQGSSFSKVEFAAKGMEGDAGH